MCVLCCLTSNKTSNEEPKCCKQLPGIDKSTAQGDCQQQGVGDIQQLPATKDVCQLSADQGSHQEANHLDRRDGAGDVLPVTHQGPLRSKTEN